MVSSDDSMGGGRTDAAEAADVRWSLQRVLEFSVPRAQAVRFSLDSSRDLGLKVVSSGDSSLVFGEPFRWPPGLLEVNVSVAEEADRTRILVDGSTLGSSVGGAEKQAN